MEGWASLSPVSVDRVGTFFRQARPQEVANKSPVRLATNSSSALKLILFFLFRKVMWQSKQQSKHLETNFFFSVKTAVLRYGGLRLGRTASFAGRLGFERRPGQCSTQE